MFEIFVEFYVLAIAVYIPAMVIALFAINGTRTGLDFAQMLRVLPPLIIGLGLWFGLTSAMAKAGMLTPPPTATDAPYILFLLSGGTGILWAYGRFNGLARQVIQATDQSFLIGFQIPRVMGFVFLVGWAVGALPWEFALPAGVGDIWAGVAGYRAARAVRRGDADAMSKVMRANIIGLLDFTVAVGTGLITSKGFAHILSKDTPNIINDYPLALFPAFLVPVFIAFHLFSLGKLRQSHTLAMA